MVKKVGHRKELVKKGGKEGGVGKVGKGAVKEASKKSLLSKPASSLRRKPSGAVRCFCLVWCLVFLFVWCCFVAWCGAVWLLCSVVEIPCFCVVSLNYIKTTNITPNNLPTPTHPQQPTNAHSTPTTSTTTSTPARSQNNLHFDKVRVEQRQQGITNSYQQLTHFTSVSLAFCLYCWVFVYPSIIIVSLRY